MKKLLLALAIMAACASPASAINDANGYVTYYPTRQTSASKRIMVVTSGRFDAQNTNNQNNARRDIAATLGNLTEMLERESGCEVHLYKSTYFSGNTFGSKLWREAGFQYGAALMVFFPADASSEARWFSADSTNVQMLHMGGPSPGNAWNDVSSLGTCDSVVGARASVSTDSSTYRYAISNRARADGSRDTLAGKFGYSIRRGVLPSGVQGVYKLFAPYRVDGPATTVAMDLWARNPDSVSARMGTAADGNTAVTNGVPGDSLAQPLEIMPLAYRVQWNGSGRSVYFMPTPASPSQGDSWGHIAWAILARTVQLNPIRYAYEWDDVVDNNPTDRTRTTNAAMDSLYRGLQKDYGITTTTNLNPNSAALYIQGSVPAYESAWSGSRYSWIRDNRIAWTFHAHDTSQAITGQLLGRFGGYSTGNGANIGTPSSAFRRYLTKRYASRFNPGNADISERFGIVQRMAYSDSLRRAYCPECPAPPYLTFPNNEMLPSNWRTRTAVSSWSGMYGSTGTIPVDSLLWALHVGSGTPSGQTLYLRAHFQTKSTSNGYFVNMAAQPNPWGDFSIYNTNAQYDRDSLVAATPFAYGGERMTTRIGGRYVKVRNVSTIGFGSGLNMATDVLASGQVAAAQLLGFNNQTQRGGGTAYVFGQSYSADPNGIKSTSTRQPVNFTAMARTRSIYQHPQISNETGLSTVNALGPSGNREVQLFRTGIGHHLRAMDTIAGYPVTKCVMGWEVYGK